MSSLLSKIGLGVAALFVFAGLAGFGATATADGGDGGSTPPPTTTTPPADTNGNPWHD
jgi:hypothetical protein